MNTTLESVETIIGVIARERTRGNPDNYEDAFQEGMIHAWQALVARPDAPRAYIVAAARNGVTSVSMGRAPTGKPSTQGKAEVQRVLIEDFSAVDQALDPWNAVDMRIDVEALMEKWSAEQRMLTFLVFQQGMTLLEASAWMGKAPQWGEREMRFIKDGDYRSTKERLSRAQSVRSRKRYQ